MKNPSIGVFSFVERKAMVFSSEASHSFFSGELINSNLQGFSALCSRTLLFSPEFVQADASTSLYFKFCWSITVISLLDPDSSSSN